MLVTIVLVTGFFSVLPTAQGHLRKITMSSATAVFYSSHIFKHINGKNKQTTTTTTTNKTTTKNNYRNNNNDKKQQQNNKTTTTANKEKKQTKNSKKTANLI